MDKQTLAKLYLDAFDKVYSEKGDKTKWEKYGKQILDDPEFGDVVVKDGDGEDTTVNHKLVWAYVIAEVRQHFPIYKTTNAKVQKTFRKEYTEEALTAIVAKAEDAFMHCSDLEGDGPKRNLGLLYSAMAYYYLPNDEGKAKVAELIKKAKEREIPEDMLSDLLSCPAVPAEIMAELEEAELKNKKKEAIANMQSVMPQLSNVWLLRKGAKGGSVSVAKASELSDDYIKETFKSELEETKTIPADVKAALLGDDAEIKVQLIYVPGRVTNWTSTPASYDWKYTADDGIHVHYGSFSYGGGSCHEVLPCTGSAVLHNFIYDTVKANYTNTKVQELNDAYVSPATNFEVPSELKFSDDEALRWLRKDQGIPSYQINIYDRKQFCCTSRASYDYTNRYVYFPVYCVWIKAGDHIVKGAVDGCDTANVKVWEAATIQGEDEIQYYVSKTNMPEYLVTKSQAAANKKANAKAAKDAAKKAARTPLRVFQTVVFILTMLMTAISCLYDSKMVSMAISPAVVSLVAFLFGKMNKFWKVVCTIALVGALVGAIGVFVLFSGMFGGADSVMPQ